MARTSRERMLLERERLWPRVWLLAAGHDRLRGPGDWYVADVGVESVLLTCAADGMVSAFHNVCPHRGNRLCDARRGSGAPLTCGYHGWSYGLDGAEARGRGKLAPVRCETFAGFVWVCMSDDAPPLAEFLGGMAACLTSVDLARWHRAVDVSVDLAANWLLSAEAHLEAYHVPVLHAGVEVEVVKLEELGAHGHLELRVHHAGAHSRNDLYYVFPNTQLIVHEGSVLLFQEWPHATDPERSVFHQQRFAEQGSAEVAHHWVEIDASEVGPVTASDLHMSERVQRGVRSRGFLAPRFAPGEELLVNARRSIAEYLEGPA